MPLSVNISISGGEGFIQKLGALGPKLTDFKEALTDVGKQLTDYYSGEVFQSQGAQFGTPWAQLSPSTIAFKSRHYQAYAALPLIATGTMQHSFRARASARTLVVDNTAPYFVYHQSSASRHKLPRRQMIGVDDRVKGIIKQTITADVHKKIGLL